MKLGKNFEIRTLVANKIPLAGGGQVYGDIYNSVDDMLREHPDAAPVFGFAVVDSATGTIPAGYEDFYGDIESAYRAWCLNSVASFKLTLEFDSDTGKLLADKHDGQPAEAYTAGTLADIQCIAEGEIRRASAPGTHIE